MLFAQFLFLNGERWSDPLAFFVTKMDKMSMTVSGDISKSSKGCMIGCELSGANVIDLWKVHEKYFENNLNRVVRSLAIPVF